MEDYRKFLDPKFVSQLKGMDLIARLIVEGFLIGFHKSPFHGFSVEFKEHRPYSVGDEIKWIDWKVYARSERFYIRKFEEETNLKAYLLIDVSKSMDYPLGGLTKLDYVRFLAAALSYLFILQRDAVGLLLFDERVRRYLPPRSSKTHLDIVFKELSKVKPGGRTDPSKIFLELAERMKKRGLVILFSDLMMPQEVVVKSLGHFRHRKHEVIVFHILSPEEMDLPLRPALFEDMETGEAVPYDPDGMRRLYRRKFEEYVKNLRRSLRKRDIDYEFLLTDRSYERALIAYLKKREKLH
jgi:uncharacterized protein (DUF58 family)